MNKEEIERREINKTREFFIMAEVTVVAKYSREDPT
jgi:hypothetical protein